MAQMNAEQIIKALECCVKAKSWADCKDFGCPAHTAQGCYFYLRTDDEYEDTIHIEIHKDALALIKSQEQRIEELEAECKKWQGCIEIECEYTKADTVRKMQERIKEKCKWLFNSLVVCMAVDKVAKEMLEGEG